MKRANGEGSITYNEERQRYELKISFTDPNTGESGRKLFTSKKSARDAKKKADTFLEVLITPKEVPSMTLSVWLNQWLNDYVKNTVKIKTYERYCNLVDRNIKPYPIAQYDLDSINASQLQKHFNHLLHYGGIEKTGLAPRSINATRRLLISAFRVAVDSALIEKNTAERTKALKVDRPDIHVLTFDEGKRLISAALKRSRIAWLIVSLALGTGMRISEIYGLEWENIDFEAKTLKVDKIVVTTSKGIHIQNTAKTKTSQRTIPLPDNIIATLKRYRLWQKVQSIRFGYPYVESPWVLSNQEGVPRSPNSFSAHQYKDILRNAGISTDVRIHDLRHTHATWLLDAGINVKVVSERLGHSNCRITLDTYAHCVKTMQDKAVDALNNILGEIIHLI